MFKVAQSTVHQSLDLSVCECACVQRFEDNLECPFSDATRISFVFQIFYKIFFDFVFPQQLPNSTQLPTLPT